MDDDAAQATEAIRDSARDYLSRSPQIARRRAAGGKPEFDRKVWSEIAEAGWFMIMIPEQDGGLGLGLREVAAVAEEVGRALLPEPFIASGVLPVAALCALPSAPLRDELLEGMASGALVAALAWQESVGQIDPVEGTLRYRRDGDQLILDGEKCFVMPGRGEDGWLLLAAGSDGAALIWVQSDTTGVSCESGLRLDGTSVGGLSLKGASVASSNVLAWGEDALAAVRMALDTGRIAQSAELIGVARQTLSTTLDYMKTRVQFGKPIGSFQALQHRMVDAWMQIELAATSLADALTVLQEGKATIGALASRVKARSAGAAQGVTRLAIQMHGAIGYTDEYDIGLYFKRSGHLSSWLGNAGAHRQRYLSFGVAESSLKPALPWSGEFPREADWEKMSEPAFRGMMRAFFAAHYPDELRHMPWRLHWHQISGWYRTLAAQGWIAPAWPREFGGMALPPDKLLAFIEEQEQYGVGRAPDQGLVMLGPVLIRFGTVAQQQAYLPKILSGEHVWAQGYSEPNAGSDLASLRTEAVLQGDEFIVTGQKTWSTLAQDASHMFMLVRTDNTGKKQQGISFLMVDLKSPGVTVRPIRTIGGDEEFCEVFFDQVRVPRENLVGELHQGWGIAKTLLGFERIFTGSPKHSQYALTQVAALARARGVMDDPVFRERFAQLQLDAADLACAYSHFANIVKQGKPLPAEVSLLKIWATETHAAISVFLVELAQEHGGSDARISHPDAPVFTLAPLLSAMAGAIFSGSNEIQRNILAKQVLGLPS